MRHPFGRHAAVPGAVSGGSRLTLPPQPEAAVSQAGKACSHESFSAARRGELYATPPASFPLGFEKHE